MQYIERLRSVFIIDIFYRTYTVQKGIIDIIDKLYFYVKVKQKPEK